MLSYLQRIFSKCYAQKSVSFEDGGHLVRIEARVFQRASLGNIIVPVNVECMVSVLFELMKGHLQVQVRSGDMLRDVHFVV